MKILYVITGLGLGGAERVVANLADEMYKRGHKVKIAYLTGDVKVKPKTKNIEIIYLGLEGWSSFFSASQKYRDLINSYKPDVVHSHMVHANIFTRLNRILKKIPKLVCTAHSSNEGGKIRMLAYKYTNFLSNFNTNVSQAATEAFIKSGAFTRDNIQTIYNGIDLDKFNCDNKRDINPSSFNSSEVNFLSVGRFEKEKDYPNLIKAVYLVKKIYHKPIKFYIAGEGRLRPLLENLIEKMQLSNDIILLGARADIPELLNQSNFFILPSKYEGFGLVVAEAMACKCFVISTNSLGPAEIMGDTGILVEPQNPAKLADAILYALTLSPEIIQENNERARIRIEELFSLEKSVETWLDIYAK